MTRMSSAGSILCTLATGAALMYLLDPANGRRRRALVADKARRLTRQARDASETLSSDVSIRMSGLKARLSRTDDQPTDERLRERVMARLGRYSSHPRAVDVSVREGRVYLTGPVLAAEAERLVSRLRSVPGVASVEDWMERHATADIPSLQGDPHRPGSSMLGWSPTTRALIGTGVLTGLVAAATYAITNARRTVADAATNGLDLNLVEEGWSAS